MRSLVRVVAAVARNRALTAVLVAYGVFSATQNAAWIGMLVYAYDRGGAGTAGAVAIAQLLPAALLAPVAAAIADRRSPVGVLVGGYLVQVAGMLATALAIGLEVPPAAYVGAVVASAAVATTPGSAVRSHMELAGRGFSLVRDSRDAAGGAADPKL